LTKKPNNKILLYGLVISIAFSFLLFKIWGAANLGIGLFWGFSLSYIGFSLFLLLPNKISNKASQTVSVMNYLIRSGIRITTMLILFVCVVFYFKINSLGLLIGTFAGLMLFTFLFLYRMKFNVKEV
jgi:hypothetical protein